MPKKLTIEEFINKASQRHNDKYDYSKAEYVNATTAVNIICPIHGPYWQIAYYHLNGNGCLPCGIESRTTAIRKSLEHFVKESQDTHGNYYDYSCVSYKSGTDPVTIICPKHGAFLQAPNNHIRGVECPLCYRSSHLRDVFISTANKIHSNKYDYSLITAATVTSYEKVKIICPQHGVFLQEKRQHLLGRGCRHPACCRCPNSKLQQQWITSLQIPTIISPHRLKELKLSVDGYDPVTKTVYEFYGDFWHGNPIAFSKDKIHPLIKVAFGSLYEKTMRREKIIKKAGYNLFTIWETDWLKQVRNNKKQPLSL